VSFINKVAAEFKNDFIDSASILEPFPESSRASMRYMLLAHYFHEPAPLEDEYEKKFQQILLAVKRYYIALWIHKSGHAELLQEKKQACYTKDNFGRRVLDEYDWNPIVDELVKNAWYELHDFLYAELPKKYLDFAQTGNFILVYKPEKLRFALKKWMFEHSVVEDTQWAIDGLIDPVHEFGLNNLEKRIRAEK